MKKTLLLGILIICTISLKSEVFMVEVGGGGGVTPYYEPQFLTINVGDTIIWDFVLGTHNVTVTSGPELFGSENLTSPTTFMHIFTIAGSYDYECSLFNHADTQFGTITVEGPNGIEEPTIADISIYPNPAVDFIKIEIESDNEIEGIQMINSGGAVLNGLHWNKEDNTIDLVNISNGIYIVSVSTSKGIIRKNIKVER